MSRYQFLERTNELEQYQRFLTEENPWVLIIRGLGGIGKTTFLDALQKQTPRDTFVVRLDFAEESLRGDYLTFLGNVSQRIESNCDPERTVELKKCIADGRFEIGKHVATIIQQKIKAESAAIVQGAELTIETEASIQETRRQMREAAREKFYAQMKTFSMRRLVVMLDTCEWLNEDTAEAAAARWAGTELFKELRSRMLIQGKLCYVVMTSRVQLQLEGINDSEIKQVILKMLSKEEVNQYLAMMEIHNPVIQDYIYKMTYGHPHSIAIIQDILNERWDRPLSVADLSRLRDLFYERAIQDIVNKDVIKHLLKSPLDKLTYYGVLLRRFNLPLLQAVFQEWLPDAEARNHFNQLIRYPHVEGLGGFKYVFHMLLREILSRYIQVSEPDKWRRYHQLALEFLSQVSSHSPDWYSDWYYHLLACDEEMGVSYWNDVNSRKPDENTDALREAARDKTLTLKLATRQSLNIQRDDIGNIA